MSSKDGRLLMLILKHTLHGTDFRCDQLEIDLDPDHKLFEWSVKILNIFETFLMLQCDLPKVLWARANFYV